MRLNLNSLSTRLHSWGRIRYIFLTILSFVTLLIISEYLGGGVNELEFLDDKILYTPKEAYAIIETYGSEERKNVILVYLIWDFVFPTVYTLMMCLIISWIYQRAFTKESSFQKFNTIPILGGLFDLMENFSIVGLILSYPRQSVVLARMAMIFTFLKFRQGIIIGILIIVGIGALIYKFLQTDKKERETDDLN